MLTARKWLLQFCILHSIKMANGTKVVFKSKVRLYRTFLFLLFLGSAVIGILAAAVVLVVSLLFIEALICSRHSIVPPAAPPVHLCLGWFWRNYLACSQNALNACNDYWRQFPHPFYTYTLTVTRIVEGEKYEGAKTSSDDERTYA